MNMTKFVIITGGVLSGLGKGIVSSSLGKLLIDQGVSVSTIKIDPYLNCDAKHMDADEHGEIFVLKDGTEVDQDFGNYERFLNIELTGENNITTGKVYKKVIDRERSGGYQGKTVQIIPHVTNEIKRRIWDVADDTEADVILIEIGGTVGDIEGMPFLEAIRQLHMELNDGKCDSTLIHTTLVPVLDVVGEQKTKPTQHSVKKLREIGLKADVIVGRSKNELEESTKDKIALFCEVPKKSVISSPDVDTVYKIPLVLRKEGLAERVKEILELDEVIKEKDGKNMNGYESMDEWEKFIQRFENPKKEVDVGLVGNHGNFEDIHASCEEALNNCRGKTRVKTNIRYIDPTSHDACIKEKLKELDGVLVPGTKNKGAAETKIQILRYARKNSMPTLTISQGYHLAVAEFARDVLGYEDANSPLYDKDTPHPIASTLNPKRTLGEHEIQLKEGSMAHDIYGSKKIKERHRHLYEVNLDYKEELEEEGLIFSAFSVGEDRLEMLELENHPFYLGCQYLPQFRSSPMSPAPVFLAFVEAMVERKGN